MVNENWETFEANQVAEGEPCTRNSIADTNLFAMKYSLISSNQNEVYQNMQQLDTKRTRQLWHISNSHLNTFDLRRNPFVNLKRKNKVV